MKLNKFKLLSFLFLALFLYFSVSPFAFANNTVKRGLEIKYPVINGIEITTSTTIAEYTVYIFSLSLIIAAIAAFVAITYGGIRYLFSFNNPEAMKDARTWISSGVIGLSIILASYLILTTINRNIVNLKIKSIEPLTGIYLINGDEKKYISQNTNGISFEATSLEFRSTEDKLYSVFTCSEKIFNKENSKEIMNKGRGSTSNVSNVKSIYFLWNRPGVYLYAKPNYNTPPPPLSFQSSSGYLEDFNDKTKSIRIKDVEDEFSYLAILFSELDFEGEDGIGVAIKDSENLNYVKNKISSIDVSRVIPIKDAPADRGEVVFYDDIDCNKKEHTKSVKAGDSPGGNSLPQFKKFGKSVRFNDWPVLSFEIKGDCWVIFNTEENFSGRSHIFRGEGCHPTLKGSYVYLPHPEDKRRPKIATVFCGP